MVQKKKAEIRRKILQKRDGLGEEDATRLCRNIEKRLFKEEHFRKAKVVAFYLPIKSEVDTRKMIELVMKEKEVVVPVTNDHVEMVKFTGFEKLKKGKYGVLEPKEKIPTSREPEVIIIPGACFGLCMHRIGYGKGYYDKYLRTSAAYRIGICYDFQVLEKLPKHEDDERMDLIVTDKRKINLI